MHALLFILRTRACVHVAFTCACVHVAYTCACVHVAYECACVHVAYTCACVHVAYTCACVHVAYTCACVHVAYECLCSCCVRVLVFMLRTSACVYVAVRVGTRQRSRIRVRGSLTLVDHASAVDSLKVGWNYPLRKWVRIGLCHLLVVIYFKSLAKYTVSHAHTHAQAHAQTIILNMV